jgi:hypothetical protein
MDAIALLIVGSVLYAVILPFAHLVVALRYGKASRLDALGWFAVGVLCLVGASIAIPAHAVALSVVFGVLPWIPRAAAPVSARVSALLASARG